MITYYHLDENRTDFIRIIRNVGDENKVTFTNLSGLPPGQGYGSYSS